MEKDEFAVKKFISVVKIFWCYSSTSERDYRFENDMVESIRFHSFNLGYVKETTSDMWLPHHTVMGNVLFENKQLEWNKAWEHCFLEDTK